MATKIDFKRDLDCYKANRQTPRVVTVPDLQYLMIDGHGDPNTSAFSEATTTLYPVAYRLKFASRKAFARDYVVMPLEGLWWADDMGSFTGARDKTRWDWTLMTMVPEWITLDMFTQAVEQVAAKDRPARLDDLRLETLSEGLCVQRSTSAHTTTRAISFDGCTTSSFPAKASRWSANTTRST